MATNVRNDHLYTILSDSMHHQLAGNIQWENGVADVGLPADTVMQMP